MDINKIKSDVFKFIPAYKALVEGMEHVQVIGLTFGALGGTIANAIANNPSERDDILNAANQAFKYMINEIENDLANRMKASFNTIN